MNFQDVIRDVHDPSTHSFKTVGSAAATLYAVVNTGAASDSTLKIGFVTAAISTPTLFAVVNTAAAGQASIVLDNSIANIGFATVRVASIAAGANYVGLASVNIGGTLPALSAGVANIGFATVTQVNQPALVASTANIGSVSVLGGTINAVLQTSTLNIGSVSILGGSIVAAAGVNGIGFVTAKIDAGTQFIGLVTAWSRNAGTTKTLVSLPVGLGNNSLATVAVPTNANKINLTQLILNSNVTTEIAIKSGVTYLTGNASLGVTLFPGGGFVMSGAPDSPAWIGLPSGAMVIEKRDGGGTVSKIGGSVIYFDE